MRKFMSLCHLVILCLSSFFFSASAFAARSDLVIAMQLEPPHLDPTSAAAGAIDGIVYANIFEGLTRYTSQGTIAPALARSWNISDDGLIYEFELQPKVSFHDGSAMDSADVKFTLERARAAGSTNAQKRLFADIASVDIIDAHHIRITLSRPNGNFLTNLAWGDAVIVAPESIANIKTNPIGTGPFIFTKWQRGDHIKIERNQNYWGEDVALDKAVFKFISDPTAAFAAMMTGEIDAFPVFPAPENLGQFAGDPRFRIMMGTTEGETILAINNRQPPFDDVRVRKAIAHAIDRQAIIDGAMFGYGTPIGTHFAPHHPAYLDLTGLSNHDVEKSRQLLAKAGYPDGFETSLKLPPPSYARRGGEILAAQLRKVGIDARIINLEWAQWLEEVFHAKDYSLTIVSHTEPLDIDIYARPDYYFQYDNPEIQELLITLSTISDQEARIRTLQQMQEIIATDYVNGFLFQLAKTDVVKAGLYGLWQNAPTQANDLTGVYWQN